MKRIELIVVLALIASGAVNAQSINQQLTEQSIITLTSPDGKRIVFSIPEAKATSISLWEQMDPNRADNQYMPPAMKERLGWIRNNAYRVDIPTLPDDWGAKFLMNHSPALAGATFCSIPGTVVQDKPCVKIFISMIMVDLKLEFNLNQPDNRFKNTFALVLSHEGVHLERGRELNRIEGNQEKVALEEIRTWFKVVKDMAAPLRKMGQPITLEYENLDDLLKPCDYKLPCKAFETFIRRYKVADVKNLKQ